MTRSSRANRDVVVQRLLPAWYELSTDIFRHHPLSQTILLLGCRKASMSRFRPAYGLRLPTLLKWLCRRMTSSLNMQAAVSAETQTFKFLACDQQQQRRQLSREQGTNVGDSLYQGR